jgi:hypothetical protein
MGERIPSFSTANTTSISPNSRPNSGTREHYSPWDKSETSPSRRFDFQSTEPIHEENEDQEDEEEEQHIPANVLGGLVPAGALSPAMQRSPPTQQQHHHHQASRRSSDAYIPHAQRYCIANRTSPPESPSSPGSSKKHSPTSASYFTHSRAQSFANDSPSSPVALPLSNHVYAQSEGSATSRNKKRNSLSHLLISATGFSGAGRRDEAAQMEEGQSPAFAPRREEEGLYQRRSHDIVEEEV